MDLKKWEIITGVSALGGLFIWRLIRAFQKSEDPFRLLTRWIVTGIMLGGVFKIAMPMIFKGGQMGVIAGMLALASCAIVIGITWAPSWSVIMLKPLTSSFDGGDEEIEAKPLYSMAEVKRNKGQFREAIAEIQRQLEKFPNDYSGVMMLASIQAENLNDLAGAQINVERIVNQPKQTDANIVGALQQLADWHLKFGQDVDAARQCFEKIILLLPDTVYSQMAAQRISHLSSTQQLLETHDRPIISMPVREKYLGLSKSPTAAAETTDDSSMSAINYIKHLEKHPLDSDAREKLALVYADQYKRLDMASTELEQLIVQPNQPAKQIVRWLNLLADLQIKFNDEAAATRTVKRIQELFPNSAAAEKARTRLAYLRMEAKGNEKSQGLKLGSFDKDLGLKKT